MQDGGQVAFARLTAHCRALDEDCAALLQPAPAPATSSLAALEKPLQAVRSTLGELTNHGGSSNAGALKQTLQQMSQLSHSMLAKTEDQMRAYGYQAPNKPAHRKPAASCAQEEEVPPSPLPRQPEAVVAISLPPPSGHTVADLVSEPLIVFESPTAVPAPLPAAAPARASPSGGVASPPALMAMGGRVAAVLAAGRAHAESSAAEQPLVSPAQPALPPSSLAAPPVAPAATAAAPPPAFLASTPLALAPKSASPDTELSPPPALPPPAALRASALAASLARPTAPALAGLHEPARDAPASSSPAPPPPPPPPPPPEDTACDNLFAMMPPLSEAEYEAAPSYLRAQLPLPLARLNECLDKVNETVNDKRFGDGDDFVTQEELVAKLGLGGKTKTFLLLLQHCGRLKADLAAKAENGNVRYSVCI